MFAMAKLKNFIIDKFETFIGTVNFAIVYLSKIVISIDKIKFFSKQIN